MCQAGQGPPTVDETHVWTWRAALLACGSRFWRSFVSVARIRAAQQ